MRKINKIKIKPIKTTLLSLRPRHRLEESDALALIQLPVAIEAAATAAAFNKLTTTKTTTFNC